jgi:hypothetical protein
MKRFYKKGEYICDSLWYYFVLNFRIFLSEGGPEYLLLKYGFHVHT